MKSLSIMLLTTGILLFSSCSKEADSISPEASDTAQRSSVEGDSNSDCKGKPGKPPKPEEVMAKLDSNGDGLISQEEAQGPLKKDFSKADKNQDGFIDIEELKRGCPRPPASKQSN